MNVRLLPIMLMLASTAGCGYTVLERRAAPEEKDAPPGQIIHTPEGPVELPPGHPPIADPLSDEEWIGTSFLDHLVGEYEPLRFESIRGNDNLVTPPQHVELQLKMTIGEFGTEDVWRVRMDQFGWITTALWTIGSAGNQPDEGLAQARDEFRLDRQSEEALRAMVIALLPATPTLSRRLPKLPPYDAPPDFWPYFNEPGLLEVSYAVEQLDTASPSQWPGGTLIAQFDLISLLIGTWDSAPPEDLVEMVWGLVTEYPLLLDVAMVAEAVVLAWEIEGPEDPEVELPIRVGR